MRFGLIANLKRIGAGEAITGFIKWARDTGNELILCEDLRKSVPDYNKFKPRDELVRDVDYIVSMGGDGTILSVVRSVGSAGTPILGINLGSLGFLTQQTPKELVTALDAIVGGEFRIEKRMMLKVEIPGRGKLNSPYALTDVVLDNGPISRVLDVTLNINGEDIVTYTADGLIISTPTGSTAYNLAVGGPIVSPGMDAMIASPISPFSLTTRPMIIPPGDLLELTVRTDQRSAMLTMDGQVGVEIEPHEKIRIRRAKYRGKFVIFPENSYYKLLRSKLNWGVPPNF
ncbi:NAD(+) kinase [candidate division GN15 bacterium]|nr:NAD(+) kinase [candidate division GN15 bacterium]